MSINTRITVNLSEFAVRKLILWARAHNKTKTAYAAQIIESRCEANLALIDELVADCARAEGVSPDELVARWLSESDSTEAAG